MKPSAGRIVHYRLEDRNGVERWRPATVTQVFSGEPVRSNMVVLLDGPNDADLHGNVVGANLALWVGSALEGIDIGCWRWPPREA